MCPIWPEIENILRWLKKCDRTDEHIGFLVGGKMDLSEFAFSAKTVSRKVHKLLFAKNPIEKH